LLEEIGINHKLKRSIKPSKHPYMRKLERYLKAHNFKYIYFSDTDSLAITEINYHPFKCLSNTLMTPSNIGINVMMVMNGRDMCDKKINDMEHALDYILLDDLCYNIIGVV
tara:strand:+ start:2428 stop:2760 length:333 start_codon:yes stop_codon:yes gene_type:complete